MTTPHVKLTIVCPTELSEQMIEALLEYDRTLGFTTFAADGHGQDFATASVRERVRGRVHRKVVVAVLPAGQEAGVLARLRRSFSTPTVIYWTEPVAEFGDLA